MGEVSEGQISGNSGQFRCMSVVLDILSRP